MVSQDVLADILSTVKPSEPSEGKSAMSARDRSKMTKANAEKRRLKRLDMIRQSARTASVALRDQSSSRPASIDVNALFSEISAANGSKSAKPSVRRSTTPRLSRTSSITALAPSRPVSATQPVLKRRSEMLLADDDDDDIRPNARSMPDDDIHTRAASARAELLLAPLASVDPEATQILTLSCSQEAPSTQPASTPDTDGFLQTIAAMGKEKGSWGRAESIAMARQMVGTRRIR
ncbi:hypothetical protein J8273_4250 [Carpediemonas membranifera]|uniref:Uncharacterized protein n=1 Tax=Carpediemonas membranifera TaxID=201153 RepID=A0A8J6E217_9EUKA|nr:hypothetical protein J8273_4250 [Carpediemonas membranifera]|eukprot:KAG9394148.1 hypothetical protein J8273_4250 [Carpediemonas membranifera]